MWEEYITNHGNVHYTLEYYNVMARLQLVCNTLKFKCIRILVRFRGWLVVGGKVN